MEYYLYILEHSPFIKIPKKISYIKIVHSPDLLSFLVIF